MKLYRGREWSWWIRRNGHYCEFCREVKLKEFKDRGEHPMSGDLNVSLGMEVFNRFGIGQYSNGYWKRLHQIWLQHMKKYHPEIINPVTLII